MTAPKDWTQLPLTAGGRSLVEASAGTGKTWTIAVLYLRLLLDEELSPRRIIVSTFTNAAAAELAERLRGKLLWALAEAQAAPATEDTGDTDKGKNPDRTWLHGRWRGNASVRATDVQRLQSALAEFDAAPVSTLHALCSRILADHPFAAGALFRGRDMIDGKTLEADLVDDLWRVIAQGDASDELVQLARKAGVERKTLKKYVPVLLQPNMIVDGFNEKAFRGRFDFLGNLDEWAATVDQIVADDALFTKTCTLRKAWPEVAAAIRHPKGNLRQARTRIKTLASGETMAGVSAAGKKNEQIKRLAQQSTGISEALAAIPDVEVDLSEQSALRHFLAAAQAWCREAMQSRLDAANQSTFDQLLYSVRDALQPRDGERALADALFAEWPVALVDEFQDTDPVQFGILEAIYSDAEDAPRGRLVMIGDPKQAIYRFRGGDVQAYERAKAKVAAEDRLTLDTNHRSSRAYVEAVNQFYDATGHALGPKGSTTGIQYEDVKASDRRDGTPLLDAQSGQLVERPLVVHLAGDEESDGDLETQALQACAGQITKALSDEGYAIVTDEGDQPRPLQPGDIAVLLPSHAQISKLAVMLKGRGVPCVVSSQKSVFDSDTARDLRLVLHAALHPEDPRALRAALVTRVWGESLGGLQKLADDPAGWDAVAAGFHGLHARLEHEGPQAVVDALLDKQASRLLQTVEGERILTDLRHLGELLQEAWDEFGGGERLAAWFAQQMDEGDGDAEAADARALRLESDAWRVRLMTLHTSKGLEFPVVFLPLMWKHGPHGGGGPRWLTDADGQTKYLVEGLAEQMVKDQELEERFRILYVALTRAVFACHVFALSPEVLAKQKRLGAVPLNALPLEQLWPDGGGATHIARRLGWQTHAGLQWAGDAASSALRTARPEPARPPGPLPMRHSFTTLSGGGRRQVAEEDSAAEDEALVDMQEEAASDAFAQMQPAPDAMTDATAIDAPASPATASTHHRDLDALASVAGADFGNAVHALFELRTPGVPLSAEAALDKLKEHGVRMRERDGDIDTIAAPLAQRLQAVLETPLGSATGPRLYDLAAADMRAELEFNYLLDGVSLAALRQACEAHGEPGLVPTHHRSLAGLMNGKIDLVFAHGGRFHVLDYKGNQLASGAQACLEDYAPQALETKMLATGYRFQALLYTVAVERYLRERLGSGYRRDQHLGDCWYLFIRAVGLQLADGTPCGVWRHRFNDALLDAVQAVLGARWQEAA